VNFFVFSASLRSLRDTSELLKKGHFEPSLSMLPSRTIRASDPTTFLNSPEGWCAELSLRFAKAGDRTVLAERNHIGPLVVQRPFYPEGDVCHVYLVHPPGGIVGGDRLRLNVHVEDGAHAVVTTPAATKFYRAAAGTTAHLHQELHVAAGTLEWLPQETILFRDANARMATIVHLSRPSRFIGWEQTCYGRPACNETFESGKAAQCFELWLDNRPLLLDRLQIGAEATQARWGLAKHSLLSTLLAFPASIQDLEAARTHEVFASTLVDGVLSCRLQSSDSDASKHSMTSLWRTLRPRILGREAMLPRIWAT
jgi:urease accessory protein